MARSTQAGRTAAPSPDDLARRLAALETSHRALQAQIHTLHSKLRRLPGADTSLQSALSCVTDPAQTALDLIRRAPSDDALLRVARLCATGPVGAVADRRALRSLACILLNHILTTDPLHADALCLKGELLLPYIHYGKNDPRAPRSVLQEAFRCFDAAAPRSTLAKFLKGRWLLSMEPLHKDPAQAAVGRSLVKQAADAGCSRALVFLAHRYENPELDRTVSFAADVPKGKVQREKFILNFYMKAAEMGDPDALNDIGTSYAEGYAGLQFDFDKAVEYYVKAIDAGNVIAYDNLGTHYETGMGGRYPHRADFDKALYYYRQGCKQRCPKCAYNLGAAYEEGMNGVLPRDPRRAEKYYYHSMKLADDCNDIQTAGRSMHDLVAMFVTRIKLLPPDDQEGKRARRKLMGLLVDPAVMDRAFVKINKAISAAARGKPTNLARLVGEENARALTRRVKDVETRVKTTGELADIVVLNHMMGVEDAEETIEIAATASKRKRSKRSSTARKRRRT